jgi:hypothetical protein
MENLREKLEKFLKRKIIKISTIKTDINKDDEYQISITFNGNLIDMKSLFDCKFT